MDPIRFGTDGWRAIISKDFTFANVQRIAQAVAGVFKRATLPSSVRSNTMLVGYDTRFLSPTYARLVSEVLIGNKFQVILAQHAVPTPLVSVSVKARHLAGAVMITASHNPAEFNGVKIKTHLGGPATPELTQRIERQLDRVAIKQGDLEKARQSGRLREPDLDRAYIQRVRRYLIWKTMKQHRANILVDSMGGAGQRYIERILEGTKIKVTTLRGEPDPTFGGAHPEPLPPQLQMMVDRLRRGGFALGIANDGDADRIGAFDGQGTFVSPGQVMGLLMLHFVEDRGWGGAVVKTVSNSTLINRIADGLGLQLHETPVGFKHIYQLMQRERVLVGGEESGGIGVCRYVPERDGMLLGLLLLEMMAVRRRSLRQLVSDMEKTYGAFRYHRVDVHFPDARKKRLMKRLQQRPPDRLLGKAVVDTKSFDGVKLIAKDDSWLLWRLSGTEPILRIYAESGSQRRTERLLKFGQEVAWE